MYACDRSDLVGAANMSYTIGNGTVDLLALNPSCLHKAVPPPFKWKYSFMKLPGDFAIESTNMP
jgi:hypothetical protein